MNRMWYDERHATDAPVWLGAEEASAWADGWNAAVAEYTRQLDEAARRETRPLVIDHREKA